MPPPTGPTFPPGPALQLSDAGARERFATMEQLLLVLDSFINDLSLLPDGECEALRNGGVAK
jgi:hypothetical protein